MARWLSGLMEETFIVECSSHKYVKKNIFCLYCCISICNNCEFNHRSHHRIKVGRRYDTPLVKFDDIKKLIDCSLIKAYAIHKKEQIFLRAREPIKDSKIHHHFCSFCGNPLHIVYPYCSLNCKVEHLKSQGNDISNLLFKFDQSEFLLVESEKQQTNVNDQPDLAPTDYVQGEGSSSGWSLSDIVESYKKIG